MVEVAVVLAALLDGARPERALLAIGLRDRLDDRQGQLAFAEIVADILAGRLRVALVIEQVIDDLERDAKRVAVIVSA